MTNQERIQKQIRNVNKIATRLGQLNSQRAELLDIYWQKEMEVTKRTGEYMLTDSVQGLGNQKARDAQLDLYLNSDPEYYEYLQVKAEVRKIEGSVKVTDAILTSAVTVLKAYMSLNYGGNDEEGNNTSQDNQDS